MLNFKSTYPIGLDIGKNHIYAAQFKKSRNGLAVRGLWHKRLNGESDDPDNSSKIIVPLLREIAKYKRFRGKKAVVHMPSQKNFTFPIRFQASADEELEALIVRESEKYMPFPIEEAVIDYPSISPSSSGEPDEYAATIVASRREHTEHYISMLKKAGLNAEVFDFSVSALLRLHHQLFKPTDNPIFLGNIGHTESQLSIVTKEDILAQRSIAWGIQSIVDQIQANFEHIGDDEKAGILLKKYGLLHEDREKSKIRLGPSDKAEMESMLKVFYQIISPHIEELILECHKIIAYVRSEVPNPNFEAIYMYGLANMIGNLDAYVEKRLQIPTKLVNPVRDRIFQNDGILAGVSEGAEFALALGLAMRKVTWP
jgi:type IV pilus assembly protein PilM